MFIQITPEGYTPDGKCRLVPVELTEEMEWAAFSAGVQEASKDARHYQQNKRDIPHRH
jgi:hypothetical protein